jgi:hypothetical protein
MLASTIQFSKYGQEHRLICHHYPIETQAPCRETTHPQDTQHQEFGESRPQPPLTPTHTNQVHVSQCDRDPEETVHISEEIWPDSSGPNSAPRPFTYTSLTFHASTHKECQQY